MAFMIGAFADGLFSGAKAMSDIIEASERIKEKKFDRSIREEYLKGEQDKKDKAAAGETPTAGLPGVTDKSAAGASGGSSPAPGPGGPGGEPGGAPVGDDPAFKGMPASKAAPKALPMSQKLKGGIDESQNMGGAPPSYLPNAKPTPLSRGLGYAEDAGINMGTAPVYKSATAADAGVTAAPRKPSGDLAEQQIYDIVAPGAGAVGNALGNAWNWYTGQADRFVGGVGQGKMLPNAGGRPPVLIPQQNAPLQVPKPKPQTALPTASSTPPEQPETTPYYPVY